MMMGEEEVIKSGRGFKLAKGRGHKAAGGGLAAEGGKGHREHRQPEAQSSGQPAHSFRRRIHSGNGAKQH